MKSELDFIADYLAGDLSRTNLYDIDGVRAKIKASLAILISEEIVTKTTTNLKDKANQHIKISQKQDIEIKFWKDVVRGLVPEKSDINKYYKQIDSELEERGYKILKT